MTVITAHKRNSTKLAYYAKIPIVVESFLGDFYKECTRRTIHVLFASPSAFKLIEVSSLGKGVGGSVVFTLVSREGGGSTINVFRAPTTLRAFKFLDREL